MALRRVFGVLAVLLSVLEVAAAFQVSTKRWGRRPLTKTFLTRRSEISMYLHSSSPTTQTPPMSSQKILSTPGTTSRPDQMLADHRRANAINLSNSILASSDTLPSFPTAHGLLSPETVLRMEQRTSKTQRSKALTSFLETYRRHGPMSCLPMLSDTSVLPHLTEALRDTV